MAWDNDGFCAKCTEHLNGGCGCPGAQAERKRRYEPSELTPRAADRPQAGGPSAVEIRERDRGQDKGEQNRGATGKPRSGRNEAAPDPVVPPAVPAGHVAADGDDPDEAFWSARPVLTAIRAWARAKRAGPYAVLAEIIAGVICRISPAVQLPSLIGGRGSLNSLIAVVGGSSEGKGTAARTAAAAVDWGGLRVDVVPIGSGEGMAKTFGVGRKDKDSGDYVIERTKYRAIFAVAEIDTFAALKNRNGATLSSQLRSVYSGEDLGFSYADAEKRVIIEGHSYRACLIAGVQPRRGEAILEDIDGGLPQRFIWLPAGDPYVPDVKPAQPPRIAWEPPPEIKRIKDNDAQPFEIGVCKLAADAIDAARVARLRGDGDAIDGHTLYTRLKFAAGLALLDERTSVTEDDWSLAGYVMTVSAGVRDSVAAALRRVAAERNAAQGHAEAERAAIVSDVTDQRYRDAAARCVAAKLGPSWLPGSTLRRALTSRLRGHFDDAIAHLIAEGQAEQEAADNGRGVTGMKYRARS